MGMDIAVLGVDLGKNVCSVVGLDPSGAVVMRRKVRRETLITLAEKLSPCVVGMEACCGAHHIGRVFAAHGHDVRLMSPEYVRSYVKAQKNDDRDAAGIAEAAPRPTMRFVDLKSQDQLDMQTLHRSRDRLVGERTALINQLRAILLERGFVAPQGKRKLEQFLSVLMDKTNLCLRRRVRRLGEGERRGSPADDNPRHRRVRRIRPCRRHRAGGKLRPGARSRRVARSRSPSVHHWRQAEAARNQQAGNKYLRRQLIHGARAALPHVAERDTPVGRWAKGLLSRAHHNVMVVAYANKLARIAWAVLRRGERFAATGMPMTA